MSDVETPEAGTRAGIVAVVGPPNAGKSTLVNALVGQKVAIVSPKVQTTRTRLMGIAIEGAAQIVLADTPGIFQPRRRLDRAMVNAAHEAATDSDLTLLLVDARAGTRDGVEAIAERLAAQKRTVWLVLNKVDIADKGALLPLAAALSERAGASETYMVSALTGDGVADLKASLAAAMPEGPWLFPEDQVTDATSRLLASELTREQLYLQLNRELPYDTAVETERFEERRDGSAAIHQSILVERDSQKAIVLGARGARIKSIGEAARLSMEAQLDRRVHLFLHVKVRPGWTEDRQSWRDIGMEWTD
jgi:GTP-binding protein Era